MWDECDGSKEMEKDTEKTGNRGMRRGIVFFALFVTAMSLSACAFPFQGRGDGRDSSSEPSRVDTGFVAAGPDSYDSADTAILVARNTKESTVTFLNLDLGRRYTLSMDGATRLYDKYGDAVSMDQIAIGDIVDVTFLKSKKRLVSMQMSTKVWTHENVERYEINGVKGEVAIGSDVYKLTSNTQYVSEGRLIELMELNAVDVLSFQGIGTQILSVTVEKGHGYLRLADDAHFVGGWIEVGQAVIQRITEDMLLLVPEGSYQVNITNRGGGGLKSVVIRRDEETTLDIGDLEVPKPQSGRVLFSLSPAGAELYIDGSKVDASGPLTLEYGLHQLIARADGYQSVTRYIRVAQETAAFDLVLDPVSTASREPESSSVTDITTDYYKVYVDAPEEAEVYLNGNYVGIAPCSFRKEEGSYIITLRKTGYETRSYTVQIDDTKKDKSYSFADLIPLAPAAE